MALGRLLSSGSSMVSFRWGLDAMMRAKSLEESDGPLENSSEFWVW
jgi:hypothetical protein